MASSRTRFTALAGVLCFTLFAAGCYQQTKINFAGPSQSILFVDGTPHHLPTQLPFSRPSTVGDSFKYDVRLISTAQSQELRAKGQLEVFGFTESDIDKLAAQTCTFDDEHLAQIAGGNVVIFRGQSPSRQHTYDLTLAKE